MQQANSYPDYRPSDHGSFEYADSSLSLYEVCDYSKTEFLSEDSTADAGIVRTDRLFELFQMARILCEDVSELSLKRALIEAVSLRSSGLFSDDYELDIGVDIYGEFSFAVKNAVGYMDIGLTGDGNISYHVRNDADPSKSAFGDEAWDGRRLPDRLLNSAIEMLGL